VTADPFFTGGALAPPSASRSACASCCRRCAGARPATARGAAQRRTRARAAAAGPRECAARTRRRGLRRARAR
jgi:hypothetical protein